MGAVYSYHSQMALPATSTPKYMLIPAFQVTVRSMSGAVSKLPASTPFTS